MVVVIAMVESWRFGDRQASPAVFIEAEYGVADHLLMFGLGRVYRSIHSDPPPVYRDVPTAEWRASSTVPLHKSKSYLGTYHLRWRYFG